MSDELHIASLVVHVAPASLTGVAQAVTGVDGLVLHGTHPSGKLVVTLEGLASMWRDLQGTSVPHPRESLWPTLNPPLPAKRNCAVLRS